MQLFTDRARLVQPDFAVTDDNAADVARLCRRLDGMPLVLELAAARLRVLPLPRIVAWLDDDASLLVTTRRDVPARQATLRATLDWSHDLLPEPERELFARLSVFRGGFTVAGAAAVAGTDLPTTLDLLTRLVDKSLVRARTDGAEERYRLLEVVRQYAAERLGNQCPAVSARHAAHLLDLCPAGRSRRLGPVSSPAGRAVSCRTAVRHTVSCRAGCARRGSPPAQLLRPRMMPCGSITYLRAAPWSNS